MAVAALSLLAIGAVTAYYIDQVRKRKDIAVHQRDLARAARQEGDLSRQQTSAISRQAEPQYVASAERYLAAGQQDRA